MLQDELVQSIAKAHNADPAQVVISWAAQRGVVALPKSVTPSRIETNGKLIELTDDEMLQLNELHKQEGKAIRLVKPNVSVVVRYLCSTALVCRRAPGSRMSFVLIQQSSIAFLICSSSTVGYRPRMVSIPSQSSSKRSLRPQEVSCSKLPTYHSPHHHYMPACACVCDSKMSGTLTFK